MTNWIYTLLYRMLLASLIIVLLLIIVGCKREMLKPEPVASNCADMCYVSCLDKDGSTGVIWATTPEAAEAWDALVIDVVVPLITKLRTCEVHRKACEQCLMNLKTEKVIQ